MPTVRTNLIPNPRYIGTDAITGGGAATWTQQDVSDGAPDGGGYTSVTATADQTATVYIGNDAPARAAVTPDTVYTGSLHLRSTAATRCDARLLFMDAAGAQVAEQPVSDVVDLTPGEWTRLSITGTAPAGATQVACVAALRPGGVPLVAGDEIGVAQRLVEANDELLSYFDGDYPDTKYATYEWTGTANASPSTETYTGPPSITAAVLTSSTEPPPVQIAINDVPEGHPYAVVGIAPGGQTWQVAGGHGVSEGVQVVIVDNRAPVNVAIRYQLVTETGGTAETKMLVVPWNPPGGAESRYLVQSLDGKTVVPIMGWLDNQLPKAPVLHTSTYDVRGRRRPVMVLTAAGEGTMQVQWLLDRRSSRLLDQILADGGGIALRTDGTARDLPASDVAVITGASSSLWSALKNVRTMSDARVWDVELTWIDDPEPSSVPVAWTVGQVDALLSDLTVGEVDDMLAGMTVAEVDALDWGTVRGSDS